MAAVLKKRALAEYSSQVVSIINILTSYSNILNSLVMYLIKCCVLIIYFYKLEQQPPVKKLKCLVKLSALTTSATLSLINTVTNRKAPNEIVQILLQILEQLQFQVKTYCGLLI